LHVAIVHNAIPPDALASDQDTLVQVETVLDALRQLGHEVSILPCTLNLEALSESLQRLRPDAVFNLVESMAGSDRLQYLVPGVLDALRVPYTGARTDSLFVTVDKLLAKQYLRGAGLPTPDWQTLPPARGLQIPRSEPGGPHATPLNGTVGGASFPGQRKYIIKTITEHASYGLDDDVVFDFQDVGDIQQRLRAASSRLGRPCFAEQFIAGREFNLSVLAASPDCDAAVASTTAACEVLPAAEIDFSGFPAGKPHVVGYRAKWDAESFEFQHTPRTFDFARTDAELLRRLAELARQCWTVFNLNGYARVDFRVDESGRPWILEVNANPCLSPDAGFAAALQRAGIPFEQAIARILQDIR
jgi:D-alanine-D-alanine ligase